MSESTIVKPHDPHPHDGFWGKVGEVADFLFATKSIGNLATGHGSWGDLANIGITAASFFIPGSKLLKFSPEALRVVVARGENAIANGAISEAAKNSIVKTVDNAKFLVDNPGLHKNLYTHISTIPDGETVGRNLLDNIETDAEHFLQHKGNSFAGGESNTTVLGAYPLRDAEGNVVREVTGDVGPEKLTTYGEPVSVPKVTGASEPKQITEQLYLEGEDIHPDLGTQFELENEVPDYIKYSHLAPEDIAYYRGMGKSEQYIANANEWEKALGSKEIPADTSIADVTKAEYEAKVQAVKEYNKYAVEHGKPMRAMPEPPKRDYKIQPLTEEEMTAAEWNKVHQVNAEMPTSPEGKPYTLREHEAIPPELRSGDENVDRAAWLQAQMGKLTSVLKSGKAKSPGEIRATINKYQLEYNSIAKNNLDAGMHRTVNDLAEKLKERSLAEYEESRLSVKRGVVPFKIEEATVPQLQKLREQLLKDLNLETDPQRQRNIIMTGRKVRARLDELTAPKPEIKYSAPLTEDAEHNSKEILESEMDALNSYDYTQHDQLIKETSFEQAHYANFQDLTDVLNSDKWVQREALFSLGKGKIPYEVVKDFDLSPRLKKIVEIFGSSDLIDGELIEYLNKSIGPEITSAAEQIIKTTNKNVDKVKLVEKLKPFVRREENIWRAAEYDFVETSKDYYSGDFLVTERMAYAEHIAEMIDELHSMSTRLIDVMYDIIKNKPKG